MLKYDEIVHKLESIGWIYTHDGSVITRGRELRRRGACPDVFQKFLSVYRPRPKIAIEIGTQRGLSTMLLAQYCDYVYTFDVQDFPVKHNVWNLFGVNHKIIPFVGSQEQIDSLVEQLIQRGADFAYIDGRHDYKSTKHYFKSVRSCGRVLFDDNKEEDSRVEGVVQLCKEIGAHWIPSDLGYWEDWNRNTTYTMFANVRRFEEANNTLNSLCRYNNNIRPIVIENKDQTEPYDMSPILIHNKETTGMAISLNKGLAIANSKYLVMTHNDVVINDPEWIARARNFLDNHKEYGLVAVVGWKVPGGKEGLVSSLSNVLRNYPEAMPTEQITEVVHTDNIANVCRNIGFRADERFGQVGTAFWTEYRHLNYKLAVMKVADGNHISGLGLTRGTKNFEEQKKLRSEIFHKKLEEYDIAYYGKEDK